MRGRRRALTTATRTRRREVKHRRNHISISCDGESMGLSDPAHSTHAGAIPQLGVHRMISPNLLQPRKRNGNVFANVNIKCLRLKSKDTQVERNSPYRSGRRLCQDNLWRRESRQLVESNASMCAGRQHSSGTSVFEKDMTKPSGVPTRIREPRTESKLEKVQAVTAYLDSEAEETSEVLW